MFHYFYSMEAKQFYNTNLSTLLQQQKVLLHRKNRYGILRLGCMLATASALYFLWAYNIYAAVGLAVIFIIIFIQLIYKDVANRAAIIHLQHVIVINENELQALNGLYQQFTDGAGYEPQAHFYASDMDLFGSNSLYQFVNRTTSALGGQLLASWLLQPAPAPIILQRQLAIQELATKVKDMQHLQAIGAQTNIQADTLHTLLNWLEQPSIFIQKQALHWLRWVLPVIIITITLLYSFNVVSEGIWYLFLLIFLVIGFVINKMAAPMHNTLSAMVTQLSILGQSIAIIEAQSFTSPLLHLLQQNIKQHPQAASAKIIQLKKILDRLDMRYNIVLAIPLNIFLMWTLQQILHLETWKKQQRTHVQSWFDTLAAFEVLNSFATMHFNNPTFCFPTLKEQHFFIAATALGHPLIPAHTRVSNTLSIQSMGQVMLITGSNMAGKSTYLRSIGVNVILAMAGAPVCATAFALSPIQLISSMRVADNLAESTSTFYAELKKLKIVIQQINDGQPVLILLDEILRGTNSLDRHTGTEALIKQLIKKNAIAILATHDVTLAELVTLYPHSIVNYHFDAQTNGEELYFDYKLKDGVCTNINASLLMKKIGLEID